MGRGVLLDEPGKRSLPKPWQFLANPRQKRLEIVERSGEDLARLVVRVSGHGDQLAALEYSRATRAVLESALLQLPGPAATREVADPLDPEELTEPRLRSFAVGVADAVPRPGGQLERDGHRGRQRLTLDSDQGQVDPEVHGHHHPDAGAELIACHNVDLLAELETVSRRDHPGSTTELNRRARTSVDVTGCRDHVRLDHRGRRPRLGGFRLGSPRDGRAEEAERQAQDQEGDQ